MEKTKTSPLSFIKKWCYDKRLYFLVFFLPVAIMFSAYAFFKIHPIGDSSVLVLDLNGQYVYYYEQFRDAFHGNGSLSTTGHETSAEKCSVCLHIILQALLC